MRLHMDEWLAAIGSAILVAGLAVLGYYLARDVTAAGGGGRAVELASNRLGSDANTFFFSAGSSYAIAFWVLVGALAAMSVAYAVAGLMRRRQVARVKTLAPVEALRPAGDAESRRKAA
jgi:hypothetical protein